MTTAQLHKELQQIISRMNALSQQLRDCNTREQIILQKLESLPLDTLDTIIPILDRFQYLDESALNTVRKILGF